jgi:hypothetical protein
MRLSVKILIAALLVVLAFGLARRQGWLSRSPPMTPGEVPTAGSPAIEPINPIRPPPPPSPAPAAARLLPDNPALAPNTSVPPPPMERIQWEQGIENVLMAEFDTAQKAQKLLELYATLPAGGQVEAAQHLANLMPHTNFAGVAQIITNVLTSPDVIDVLAADLLNRPNKLKLPLLLEVARMPGHPWRNEAKQMVELYVQKDYGDDWGAWTHAVQKWLEENPE